MKIVTLESTVNSNQSDKKTLNYRNVHEGMPIPYFFTQIYLLHMFKMFTFTNKPTLNFLQAR